MKTLPSLGTIPDASLSRLELDIRAKINGLFALCPTLCGFSVQDRSTLPEKTDGMIPDADLYVTEIGFFPKLGSDQYGDIFDEITLAISDLVYEQPKAYEVLRGRTFARTLQ
jgi:hypothetical protein